MTVDKGGSASSVAVYLVNLLTKSSPSSAFLAQMQAPASNPQFRCQFRKHYHLPSSQTRTKFSYFLVLSQCCCHSASPASRPAIGGFISCGVSMEQPFGVKRDISRDPALRALVSHQYLLDLQDKLVEAEDRSLRMPKPAEKILADGKWRLFNGQACTMRDMHHAPCMLLTY